MKLPLVRIAARIFSTPLMMMESRLDVIIGVLGPRLGQHDAVIDLDGLMPQGQATKSEHRPLTTVVDGVAVIDVNGTLVHRSSWLDALCGLVSYEQISAELDAAVADPNVKAIMLNMDSPGGEVAGSFELSERIRGVAAQKPTVALAADLAASAGYLLGASATRLYATSSAITGSVGVVVRHADQSKADEMAGVKVTHIHAGANKVDGNPHEPLGDQGRATLQALVDSCYSLFVSRVAVLRGISEDAVRATEARVFVGAEAQAAGLIDGVRTPKQVLEELKQMSQTGGRLAATTKRPVTPAKAGAKMNEQEMQALIASLTKERDDLKASLTKAEADVIDLGAQVKTLKHGQKMAVIEKHVMAGRVTNAMRADAELLGENLTAEDLDARLSKWPSVTRPLGTGTSQEPPEDQKPIDALNALAAEISKANPTMTKPDAFEAACRQRPDLYKAHRAANTRVVSIRKKGA